MKNKPELKTNEQIILSNQGFYKDNLRSGWKAGHLYLTNIRFFLWQPARIIFQTPLENIKEISVQLRGFILRSKDALYLSYINQAGGGISKAWIMTNDVETWKNRIFERSLLVINDDSIDKVSKELELESRNILLYLWENRHATIEELASLYDAPNHMDVIQRIKNNINLTSERVIGFPVLTFERGKIDEFTGKKVMFSWWIIGGYKFKKRKEDLLLDIFDEEDHLNIFMELIGAEKDNITLNLDNNVLSVSCKNLESNFHEEITLPVQVEKRIINKKYYNNILKIRLNKAISIKKKNSA